MIDIARWTHPTEGWTETVVNVVHGTVSEQRPKRRYPEPKLSEMCEEKRCSMKLNDPELAKLLQEHLHLAMEHHHAGIYVQHHQEQYDDEFIWLIQHVTYDQGVPRKILDPDGRRMDLAVGSRRSITFYFWKA